MLIRTTSLLLLTSALAGCAWLQPAKAPVEVKCVPEQKTPLALEMPAPLDLRNLTWVVITPANINEAFNNLQAKGEDVVLFALTDEGYKQLSLNWAEVRKLVSEQRSIIIKYKDYYEQTTNNK